MNYTESLEHFLIKEKGFTIDNIRLNIDHNFIRTDELIDARIASCKMPYYKVTIIYRWNSEFDFLELIHYSINPQKGEKPSHLYTGSYPWNKYSEGSVKYFMSSDSEISRYNAIYSMRVYNEKDKNTIGYIKPFEYNPNYNPLIETEYHNDVITSFKSAISFCNNIIPYLCIDYPWVTYSRTLGFFEKIVYRIKNKLKYG